MRRILDENVRSRMKGDEKFQSFVREELASLKNAVSLERQTRERDDGEIVDALVSCGWITPLICRTAVNSWNHVGFHPEASWKDGWSILLGIKTRPDSKRPRAPKLTEGGPSEVQAKQEISLARVQKTRAGIFSNIFVVRL